LNKIFEVEISRPGSLGAETAAALALPATPYEILDALDRARVTDSRVIYSSEILSCELDYLPQFISPSVNLYELNHLAERLSGLSEWELDCFEGMVMMDTIRTQYAPIAIDRLINMTHSTGTAKSSMKPMTMRPSACFTRITASSPRWKPCRKMYSNGWTTVKSARKCGRARAACLRPAATWYRTVRSLRSI
jgi:hypothetical protein